VYVCTVSQKLYLACLFFLPAKSPTKKHSKMKATPQKKSKEELAAIKIQSLVRKYLAKKKLEKIKKEKHDYEELIEKLQKEVYKIYFRQLRSLIRTQEVYLKKSKIYILLYQYIIFILQNSQS